MEFRKVILDTLERGQRFRRPGCGNVLVIRSNRLRPDGSLSAVFEEGDRLQDVLGVLCLIANPVPESPTLDERSCVFDVIVDDAFVARFFCDLCTDTEEVNRLTGVTHVLSGECRGHCDRRFVVRAVGERSVCSVVEDRPQLARVVRTERNLGLHQRIFDF